MSFRNVSEWAQCFDSGRFHVTAFRKQVASAATAANDFVDYTYFAGNPVANFYASAPLEAAHVEANKGIFLRDVQKPVHQGFLHYVCGGFGYQRDKPEPAAHIV